MQHYKVEFLPDKKRVLIHQGATLLEAAGRAGIILSTPCGGKGICGKCMVQIEPAGQRVKACEYVVAGDLTVTVPEASRHFHQQILEHGIIRQMHIEPAVRKEVLDCIPASWEELKSLLKLKCGAPVSILNTSEFQPCLNSQEKWTVVLYAAGGGYDIIAIESGDTSNILVGASFDIGTTTVVLRLVDLLDGHVLTTVSASNPQNRYGDDVISRIQFAQTESGLDTLNQLIITCLNELLEQACRQSCIQREIIYEAAGCGNTTMHHLLLKYPVVLLGQAPYQAASIVPEERQAKAVGLKINPRGSLHTIANIAGFVGSDTVAAALAAGMDRAAVNTLLVDIGTNGEIVAGTSERLAAASCAAGPALEGAGILHGSRAVEGAIQSVFVSGEDLDVDVIGEGEAKSICGSGLIDAAAVLYDLGVYDASCRFCPPDTLSHLSKPMQKRRVEYNGQPAFVLSWDAMRQTPQVILTQQDLRMLQLAKAAIRTGIKLLLRSLDLEEHDLEQVFLAGAFGNYINKQSAITIGLLPEIPLDKIHSIGNAAADGVHMVLLSKASRKLCADLAGSIEHIEIARFEDFQDQFADNLFFPKTV